MDLETTLYAPAPSWTSKAINKALRHELVPKPPATVLDLGSGDGRVVREFVRRGYDGYGIEFDEQLIKESLKTEPRIKVAQGNYFPKEFRTKIQPAPYFLLDGQDGYETLGKQPEDFDIFFIYPFAGQMNVILDFFRTYAHKNAVLMALGDEADWNYSGEPQITHIGTRTLPGTRKYTLYKK